MYGLLGQDNIWPRFENLESEGAKKSKYWGIAFKVFQIKFLAMHITNQKLCFDIFTVGNLQNILMEHDLYLIAVLYDFWHKRKIDHFDPYNVLLAISTNIPLRRETGFVVQGHIYVLTCFGLLKGAWTFFSRDKILFTGESNIMEVENILMMDLFLTNMLLFILQAVWTLILTAPNHCRGSTDESVMKCCSNEKTHLHFVWPEGECFQQFFIFGCTILFKASRQFQNA